MATVIPVVDVRIRRHQRFLRDPERLLRPLRRSADGKRAEPFPGDHAPQLSEIRAVFERAPRDQAVIPHRMQVAGNGPAAIVAAVGLTEHTDPDVVAAAADAKGVKRLMQIADEVHDELQGGGAIGAIELRVAKAPFPIRDAIDDAITPAIAPEPAPTPGCLGQSRSRS